MTNDYDFCGYVTRNNVTCSDGRIIRQDAFKDCDGTRVPLVYQHDHMSPLNILGHCDLENRADGVYGYAKCNDTPEGQHAKAAVKNRDVNSFSIYANKLKQNGANVIHGAIREVSLVLAGANPGAKIDTILVHDYDDEEEAIMSEFSTLELFHSDENKKKDKETDDDVEEDFEEESDVPDKKKKKMNDEMSHADGEDKTVQDVIDTMNEEQKNVLYALVGMASEGQTGEDEQMSHADGEDKTVQDVIDTMNEEQKNVLYALVGMASEGQTGEDEEDMKHNVFADDTEEDTLMHFDFDEVIRDAKRYGSLKESFLQHDAMDAADDFLMHEQQYGVEHIDYLFPDYKTVTGAPTFVGRDKSWVAGVMQAVSHTPFARIKSVFATIDEDEARAKGYIKGKQKKEEVFPLLKRTTDPQTVYKKQKLDRDDMIDITDFDVVVWLKGEMRMMLDEELARAYMIGDGRSAGAEDKISEDHIRPIYGDDPFYTIRTQIELDSNATEDDKARALIKAAIRARKNYKGSGDPTFYTTEDNLTSMLLLTDTTGRDLYDSADKLAQKLRVSKIVTIPVFEGVTREADTKDNANGLTGKKFNFEGLIVNLKDYNVGADKGGAVSMFDDFDIDYNQQKYLIETRCSGALTVPYSAIALETYPKA